MIYNRYIKFAEMALDLCDHNVNNNMMIHRLCALVVKRNKVLSIGYNSRKTSPRMRTKMQMIHAESDAISRLSSSELSGSDIIVVRLRPSGYPGLSRPCSFCEQSLRDVGIRKAYYTLTTKTLNLDYLDLRD